MLKSDFLNRLKTVNEYAAKLENDLENTAKDIHTWLISINTAENQEENNGKIHFPKTPLASRRTRRKPKVETIDEDDEVVQFEPRTASICNNDVSFMNVSATSTRSNRSSRTASKNAYLKINAQSKQTLNSKLRRPTRSKPGVMFVQPLPPPAKSRRGKKSGMNVSVSSYTSAADTVDHDQSQCGGGEQMDLDDSILIIEDPKPLPSKKRPRSTSPAVKHLVKEAVVVVNRLEAMPIVSPHPEKESNLKVSQDKEAVKQIKQSSVISSPDLFTENAVSDSTVSSSNPVALQIKSPLKPNDPLKESVKKRVMAYEQMATLSEEMSPAKPLPTEPVLTRVTRTKTRALVEKQTKEQIIDQDILQKLGCSTAKRVKRNSPEPVHHINSSEKENSILGSNTHRVVHTSALRVKATPLTNSKQVRPVLTSANRILVQNTSGKNMENKSNSSNILSSFDTFITKPVKPPVEDIEEKKREELKKRQEKEEEAQRKRKELLEQKREAHKKKTEEKQVKALQAREALEREKLEAKQRTEREKEEKARLAAEREERYRAEAAKRKQLAIQKAVETEERRRQEEAVRLARIKEQEDEMRRAEAQRKKDEAEAERQYAKRVAREKEAAAAAAAQLAKQQAATAKKKAATPAPAPLDGTFSLPTKVRPPLKEESELNYYLADLSEGGSDSEDEQPRSKIPPWANTTLLKPQYYLQETIPTSAVTMMFSSHAQTPDLAAIFNNKQLRNLKRTSSAVWKTPPRFSRMPVPRCQQ